MAPLYISRTTTTGTPIRLLIPNTFFRPKFLWQSLGKSHHQKRAHILSLLRAIVRYVPSFGSSDIVDRVWHIVAQFFLAFKEDEAQFRREYTEVDDDGSLNGG